MSPQLARMDQEILDAQSGYTLAQLELKPQYVIDGPSASYSLEKRFNEPDPDSSYPVPDTSWRSSFGIGITRQILSGTRLGINLANEFSIPSYGTEVFNQTPRLSLSLNQPILWGQQAGMQSLPLTNMLRSRNYVEQALLRRQETTTQIMLRVIHTYLNCLYLKSRQDSLKNKFAILSRYIERADPDVAFLLYGDLHNTEVLLSSINISLRQAVTDLSGLLEVPELKPESFSGIKLEDIQLDRIARNIGSIEKTSAIQSTRLRVHNAELSATQINSWSLPSVYLSASIVPIYGTTREEGLDFTRSITDYFEPGSGLQADMNVRFQIPLRSKVQRLANSTQNSARIEVAKRDMDDAISRATVEQSILASEQEMLTQRLTTVRNEIISLHTKAASTSETRSGGIEDLYQMRVDLYEAEHLQLVLQLVANRFRYLQLVGGDILNEITILFGD